MLDYSETSLGVTLSSTCLVHMNILLNTVVCIVMSFTVVCECWHVACFSCTVAMAMNGRASHILNNVLHSGEL